MAYNIAPSKQDLLVSGTNIKTINSNSILGSGNLTIAGLPTSTNPTDADKVVAVDSAGTASWQYAGLGSGSLGTGNVVLGRSKPTSLSGTANTILGVSAANALTTGNNNTLIGNSAGINITTGFDNTLIGANLISGTNTNNTIIIGKGVGSSGATEYNIFIGNNQAANCGGNRNTAIGDRAAVSLTSGAQNTLLGMYAGYYLTSGDYNTLIGYQVLGNSSGSNSGLTNETVAIGSFSLNTGTTSKSAVLGNRIANVGGPLVNSVVAGYEACRNAPSVGNSVVAGYQAGYAINSASSNSTMLGYQAGYGVTSGTKNIFLGYTAGDAVTTGSNNVIIGDIAGTTTLADTIILAAGTAERVRIDSSGNMGIGTDSPATRLHAQQTSAATSTVTNILRVDSQSSGTPANGIGVGIEMAAETASGNTEIGVVLEAVTTDVTSTSEDFDFVVKTMAAGATAAERMKVASTGTVTIANGDMVLNTAGNGLKIATGAEATAGLATILNGNSSVTVSTNKCSANSIILVTNQTSTAYVAVTTKTSGSFKIEHANTVGADQECAWFIINPA